MKHLSLLTLILPAFLAFHSLTAVEGHAKTPDAAIAAKMFATPQVFSYTSRSTVFACGMQDANGMRYGTAEERVSRTTYTFSPDGSVSIDDSDIPGTDRATYRVRGNAVTLKYVDRSGKVTSTNVLVLSADGKTLGSLKRVVPKSATPPKP